MKLLRLTTVYAAYWKNFYLKLPELAHQCYVKQKATLDYDGFGWADFWSNALNPLGYDVIEIIANIKPLQKIWAQEHNILWDSQWILKITFEQVKKFKPTVLFIDDYEIFSEKWINELREACPSIRLVMGWCSAPYQNVRVFNEYDVILSCIPELVNCFREMGHHSEHLNHAFDPRILERIDLIEDPEIDFSFIGQIIRNNQYHLQREKALETITQNLPIQIYSPNLSFTLMHRFKFYAKVLSYSINQSLNKINLSKNYLSAVSKFGIHTVSGKRPLHPINPNLRQFIKSPVFGLEMYKTLRNSKISFNMHIDLSSHSASNMRLFESTGIGTCLVTDWKDNLHTLFDSDTEVVTYKSVDECIAKVKWLQENPQKRIDIALAGQKRTLKEHTFQHRALQLHELMNKKL